MNATKKINSKETIIVLITACLILNCFFKNQIWFYSGILLGLIGIFSNYISEKIHFAWMTLAKLMSKISTTILLFILFFLILTPMALLKKRFSAFNFLLKNNNLKSTFIDINKTYGKSDLEKMW